MKYSIFTSFYSKMSKISYLIKYCLKVSQCEHMMLLMTYGFKYDDYVCNCDEINCYNKPKQLLCDIATNTFVIIYFYLNFLHVIKTHQHKMAGLN